VGGAGGDWATAYGQNGNFNDYTSTDAESRIYVSAGSLRYITRAIVQFDTSTIPADATITSATLCLYGASKITSGGPSGVGNMNITTVTTAGNTTLSNSDYNISNYGSTRLSDTSISYANWIIGQYNNYVLNASGLAAINKGGWTKFSWRHDEDIDNIDPGGNAFSYYIPYFQTSENGTNVPYISITYIGTANGNFLSII